LLDRGLDAVARGQGEGAERGLEFCAEKAVGDPVGQVGEQGAKGDEGEEEVAGTGLDGANGETDVEGEVAGLLYDCGDQTLEIGRRERPGVRSVLECVEIAGRRTSATRAKFSVAMGAAARVTAHGPVATAGDGAADLVRVAGHCGPPPTLLRMHRALSR
jgi:hypothetical protein